MAGNQIPDYQQSIGVSDPGQARFSPQDVVNPGPALAEAGQAISNMLQPRVKLDAEKAAMEAAGEANIVKDAQGNFVRPDPPKGGGIYYTQMYDQVMNQRYEAVVTKDFEQHLDSTTEQYANDPQGFLANAEGHANGVLSAVAPESRAALDIAFTRELSERYRGLTSQKASRDYSAAVNGTKATIDANTDRALQLLDLGGEDAVARARPLVDEAVQAAERLQAMGAISPEGQRAEVTAIMTKVGTGVQLRLSMDHLAKLGPMLKGMSDDELQRLQSYAIGTTDNPDAKAGGMSLEEFGQMFPSPMVRSKVAQLAGMGLSERAQAQAAQLATEREAAADRRAAAAQATADKIYGAIKDQNAVAPMGYTHDEAAVLEAQYAHHGTAYQQMGDPARRVATVQFVNEHGFLPTGVKEWIDGQVLGGNVAAVADIVQAIHGAQSHGAWVGEQIYSQLEPKTRAIIDFDEALRRANVPQPNREAIITARSKGQFPTLEEVRSTGAFTNQPGQRYEDVRTAALAGSLAADPVSARAAIAPARDFDAVYPYYFHLYEGDTGKAASMAARVVARGWVKNSNFVGGIGPRALVTSNLDLHDVDRFLTSPSNPTGATFSNGRAKLMPLTNNPAQGFGNYMVTFFAPSGAEAGSQYIALDKVVKALAPVYKQRQAAANAAALERAKRNAPPFIVGTMPDGSRGYIPNPIFKQK